MILMGTNENNDICLMDKSSKVYDSDSYTCKNNYLNALMNYYTHLKMIN